MSGRWSFWMTRARLLVWLAWPAFVFVVSVSVIHFLRYRLGWDIYWSWSPGRAVAAVAVALVVPVTYEMVARLRSGA
jgi:hypothetical protein